MRDRFAAALQLGVGGLSRRLAWRFAMLVRVVGFHLIRRQGARRFARAAARKQATMSAFLAPAPVIRSLLSEGELKDSERERILSAAAGVLNDEVDLRGVGRVELSVVEGHWYGYPPGDAVMVNRHDFLVPLIQASLITEDRRYEKKIARLFEYWVSSFELSSLRRLDTPIDAAIRILNWTWALSFDVHGLAEPDRVRLHEIIYLQLEYISAYRSAGGNHLVLEALAAYVYGSAFVESRAGSRWRRWGRSVLIAEVTRQTSPDGVHTEQSMFYHHAVSTHFLKFFLTARAAGDALPAPALARFGKMLDYVHTTMRADLTHPVLGDGEPLVTEDREHLESKGLLAARSTLFGKPLFADFSNAVNDYCLWFLGTGRGSLTTTDEPPASTCFESGGIAVLRDDSSYVLFDAAPFSDPEFPHHGHADALSVVLASGRTNIFVDPGGYGYYDDEFRRFFRSTRAHNTVTIDGRDQSEVSGILGYGRLASAKLETCRLSPDLDFVAGSHDGYRPAGHRREVYLRKRAASYVLIVDYLAAAREHLAVASFHLPVGARIDLSRGRILCPEHGREYKILAVSSTRLEQRVVAGAREPVMQGWISPETRAVQAAEAWELSVSFRGTAFLATFVSLGGGDIDAAFDADESRLDIVSAGKDCFWLSAGDGRSQYALDALEPAD